MRDSMTRNILVAGAFPWIALFVSPITMYLGNQDQYRSFWPLLATFTVAFLAASLMLLLVLLATRAWRPAGRVVAGLLVGLALGAWVQGQLLVWDLGPLDGRGLAWDRFQGETRIEFAAWAAILLASLVVFATGSRIALSLPGAAWLLGILTLVTAIATHGVPTMAGGRSGGEFPEPRQALAFHKENNALVIVLDSFQSDAFLETLRKYPAEAAFLDGFVYYPDTVGAYPTTRHSVPMILTGRMYRNDFPYDESRRAEFERQSLMSYYAARNYGVVGDVSPPIFSSFERSVIFPPGLREKPAAIANADSLRALDVGLFRASPLPLKRLIYDESRWLLMKFGADRDVPPAPHGQDWYFVQRFVRDASTASTRAGEFKFIHLMAAHHPLSVDQDFRYVPGLLDSRENYVNQTRGALALARRMLDRLKELDVYDGAEIIITADHGAHNRLPIDLQAEEDSLEVPIDAVGGARPLLLHKPRGSRGPVRVSDIPMHLSYIPCILSGGQEFPCDDYTAAVSGRTVARPFLRYEWSQDFWFKDYSPPMTLLEVRGDSRLGRSWFNTDIVFENGGSHRIDRSYRIGDWIDFGRTGSSAKYLLTGWSVQEEAHRWTNGRRARILLDLAPPPDRDIVLELDGRGMSPDGHRPQQVSVFVNDALVAEWEILGRRTFVARIPRDLVQEGRASISFSIKEPRSPHEFNAGPDHRRLGLATFGLRLGLAE